MGPRSETVTDPSRWRFDAKSVAQIVTLSCAGLLIWTEQRHAVSAIKETIARDAAKHEKDREEIVASIKEVRDELRRMQLDSVATRQAQTWIELARAANRLKYPDLVWPDLPR